MPAQVEASPRADGYARDDLGALPSAAGQVALLDPEGTLIALAEFDPAARMGPASQGAPWSTRCF